MQDKVKGLETEVKQLKNEQSVQRIRADDVQKRQARLQQLARVLSAANTKLISMGHTCVWPPCECAPGHLGHGLGGGTPL